MTRWRAVVLAAIGLSGLAVPLFAQTVNEKIDCWSRSEFATS
jgi:hypothetical protein